MHTVVIGCSKGGVGKTTLAAALSVEAARNGNKVAIADFDPSPSLARWFDRRAREVTDSGILMIEGPQTPAAAVREARRQGCDVLIIDSPPCDLARIKRILEVSDLLIVPVRPSPFDVEAVDVIHQLADIVGIPRLIVLNAASPRSSLTKGARHFLTSRKMNLWGGHIPAHHLQIEAVLWGKTASELGSASQCSRAIERLWAEIKQRLRHKPKVHRPARDDREAQL